MTKLTIPAHVNLYTFLNSLVYACLERAGLPSWADHTANLTIDSVFAKLADEVEARGFFDEEMRDRARRLALSYWRKNVARDRSRQWRERSTLEGGKPIEEVAGTDEFQILGQALDESLLSEGYVFLVNQCGCRQDQALTYILRKWADWDYEQVRAALRSLPTDDTLSQEAPKDGTMRQWVFRVVERYEEAMLAHLRQIAIAKGV
jgi:hypothetical protein